MPPSRPLTYRDRESWSVGTVALCGCHSRTRRCRAGGCIGRRLRWELESIFAGALAWPYLPVIRSRRFGELLASHLAAG